MGFFEDYPSIIFVISFILLWLSTLAGANLSRRIRKGKLLEGDVREDFNTILTSTLTLLALLIGFSFSMSISRYDQRKQLEAEETNAIGTEYARADLLPHADAMKVKDLLRNYLNQRILFYQTKDKEQIKSINTKTAHLEQQLWLAVTTPAIANPTAIASLAVAGMNDVLNSQAYTEAAWRNRLPGSARILMVFIAICCNLLIGYGARNIKADGLLVLVVPFVISISFFLNADMDSPNGGLIRVNPDNLISLVSLIK